MTLLDALHLFGLFIVFLGLGLLVYACLFRIYLGLQLQLFPKLNEQFERLLTRLDSKSSPKSPASTTQSPTEHAHETTAP